MDSMEFEQRGLVNGEAVAQRKLEVHWLAAAFPMLPDDELAELADDILANGQQLPIKLDKTGRLIDGRNRLRACEIAGVEPRFETFDGDEGAVVAHIHSINVNRRHMSKGQRAMATAMTYPEPERRGRGNVKSSIIEGFSSGALSEARAVFHADPEAARSVMAGALPLHEAYMTVRAKTSTEGDRRKLMDKLRARYPDLAEQVEREELSLKAAMVEADDRDERARNQRMTKFRALRDAVENLAVLAFETDVAELAEAHPDDFREANPLGVDHLATRAHHVEEGATRLFGFLQALHMERTDDDD